MSIKICNFYTSDICKGRIREISCKTDIPETNKNIVTIGMLLCQTHYNQLILNESLKIKQIKTCQHLKYEVYLNESKLTKKANINKNLTKVPKRLIEVLELDEFAEICSMCRKKIDKDPEYLQNAKYKAPISTKSNNLSNDNNSQDESIEIKICQHPKHEIYLNEARLTNKTNATKNFTKIPKRLIKILGLDEFAEICSICRKRTDKDPEYLQDEKYEAPISRNIENNNILKIGNHTYSLRNDILYTGEEFKKLESDYQDIIR